jgi:hypothetical protein
MNQKFQKVVSFNLHYNVTAGLSKYLPLPELEKLLDEGYTIATVIKSTSPTAGYGNLTFILNPNSKGMPIEVKVSY